MDLTQSQVEANEVFFAQAHIYKHLCGYAITAFLGCALELDIPDVIHNHGKPITIQQLVSKLNLPVEKTLHLQSMMWFLTRSNFFSLNELHDQENGDEKEGYVLTTSSKLLLKNTSESFQYQPNFLTLATSMLDPVFRTPMDFLGKWFYGTQATLFETAHGVPMWEFFNQNPRFNRMFNDSMDNDSRMMSLVVNDCREIFEGVDSLVDVGGGSGLTAKILLEAFPHMTCTVFDLPHVVADMIKTKNLKYVGGDMFNSIPSADAIFFKNVFHNWSDDNVLKILKRCREVIRSAGNKGKLILIEMVMDMKHEPHELTETKKIFNIMMMLFFNGRERTEVEWEKLFMEAGFSRYKITPNFGMRSSIEVFP